MARLANHIVLLKKRKIRYNKFDEQIDKITTHLACFCQKDDDEKRAHTTKFISTISTKASLRLEIIDILPVFFEQK